MTKSTYIVPQKRQTSASSSSKSDDISNQSSKSYSINSNWRTGESLAETTSDAQNCMNNTNTYKAPNTMYSSSYSSSHQSRFKVSNPNQSNKDDSIKSKDHLKYTKHAVLRLNQREIHQDTISDVLRSGEKFDSGKDVVSYIDEDTKVVLGEGSRVVTLMENKRNTQYDLSRHTKNREQELIKKATFQNNDSAMCDLAEYYLRGDTGPRDTKKAYEWFLRAANKKNSHAMCKLAQLHENGDLGTKDPKAALEWMEKAAEYGNSYALAIIGQELLAKYQVMHRSSDEISQQQKSDILKKAMDFLQRSADKGSTRSMWQIAKIYKEGFLGEKNLPKAIELYSKAAKLGSPSSLTSLNDLVSAGKFSAEEFEAILDKASQLIARTSSQLAIDIGLQQIEGHLGKNPQRGLKMIEKAAQKGNEQALRILIKCYRDGNGCEPNQELSSYWLKQLKELYEKAAAQGNIETMWDLGELFLNGTLGKIDLEQAEQLFIRAATAGDIDANHSLGMMYIEGRLGNKDPAEGTIWIRKAIEMWTTQALAGDNKAAHCIGEVYFDGDLGTKDYQQALKWLSLAAAKGHFDSMLLLAKLHLNGKSGYKNIKLAIDWIEKALAQADTLALQQEALMLSKELMLKENIHETFPWFLQKALDDEALQNLLDKQETTKYTFTLMQARIINFQLAEIYRSGDFGAPDYAQAAKWYSVLAKTGHTTALMRLVKMVSDKCLEAADNTETILLVQKLVTNLSKQEVKHAKDALILGKFCKEGHLSQNLYEAVKWLCLAMQISSSDREFFKMRQELDELMNFKEWNSEEKNQIIQGIISHANESSQKVQIKMIARILGDIYTDGILTEPHFEEAIVWYEKSAKLGNSIAMYKLGTIYKTGSLGSIDLSKAIKLYILSAKRENGDAIKVLTELVSLTDLKPELRIIIEQWQKEYQSSIEINDKRQQQESAKVADLHPKTPQAMYELGKQYQDGVSKEQDYLLTAFWLRKAAEKNHGEAIFKLAIMYDLGQLGEKTRPVAINLYEQALEYYQSMVKVGQKLYPGNHPITATFLEKIGLIYYKLENTIDAAKYQEQALKMKQELSSSKHSDQEQSLQSVQEVEQSLVDVVATNDCSTILGDQQDISTL